MSKHKDRHESGQEVQPKAGGSQGQHDPAQPQPGKNPEGGSQQHQQGPHGPARDQGHRQGR